MNAISSVYQEKRTWQDKHLDEIWESWEYLIREDVERLDHRCFRALQDAEISNIPKEKRIKYFQEKLYSLIEEIADERDKKGKWSARRN